MKKYNNIKDKFNIPSTKSLLCVESPYGGDEINDFMFPKEDVFYFSYKMFFSGVYQLEKSNENLNTNKISEFSDDYMLDGHYDEYEDFDETNEVFEGDFSNNFLFKIKSNTISQDLNIRLKEFVKEKGNECEFREFFESLDEWWGMNPDDSFGLILKSIGLNEDDVELIYRDIVTNNDDDIICWYQYSELSKETFSIQINN